MFEFFIDGHRYLVEVERHGYRTRFYGIKADSLETWERYGYIGSYYPANKTCGFKFDHGPMAGADFSSSCRGPKTAAKTCLIAFVECHTLAQMGY